MGALMDGTTALRLQLFTMRYSSFFQSLRTCQIGMLNQGAVGIITPLIIRFHMFSSLKTLF